MRQKASAARPPANPPVLAVVAATVPSLGQQLREVLPPRRLHSVSLCDQDANVLWLSEGALGPDEHGVIVVAMVTMPAALGSILSVNRRGQQPNRSSAATSNANGTFRQRLAS